MTPGRTGDRRLRGVDQKPETERQRDAGTPGQRIRVMNQCLPHRISLAFLPLRAQILVNKMGGDSSKWKKQKNFILASSFGLL